MKKIISSIMLTLTMVSSFMACQEYKIDSQPEAPLALQVDAQDSYTLLATSPSRIVFNVSANTPWTIESDQQWCIPSPAMSAASALVSEIIVTTEDNNERTSRTATLTVSAEGVAESVVITIVQASKENLVVVPYDGTVSTDGGTFSFTIVSNKPWEIIPSTAFISNIDKKSGEGVEGSVEETVTVTVPANTGATRRGTLTVQTEFDTYSFEVVQSGFLLELAGVPSTNLISLEGMAAEFSTEVNSNLDWKAQVPAEYSEWLTVEREGNTIKVLAAMNNRMTVRKGQFLLTVSTPMDGFEGVVYYVEQPCLFKFNGDYTIDQTTGYVKTMISKSTMVEADFHVTKGRLKVEFEEVRISGAYKYGLYLEGDGTNYNYKMNLEDNKWYVRSGGTGVNWWSERDNIQKTFDFLPVNDMRTFEFVIEDDSANVGKLRMFMYLNGMELDAVMKGKDNPYDGEFKGMIFKIAAEQTPTEGDYVIIKSITYSPVE